MARLAYFEQCDESTDRRSSVRHVLNLGTTARSATGAVPSVLVHDLSAEGLLIETEANLPLGAEFDVRPPEAGDASATVVWTRGKYSGCSFSSPLPKAARSAALLKSAAVLPSSGADHEVDTDAPQSEDLPAGVKLGIIAALSLTAWAIPLGVIFL